MSDPEDGVDPYDLEAVSARNRSDPLEMFRAALRRMWQDNLHEEALELWRRQVAGGRWYADDVLYCFEQVLEDPPADLGEILREDGWVMLEGRDPQAWLAETIEQMKLAYEAVEDS